MLQNKLVTVQRWVQEHYHIQERSLCDSSKWKTKKMLNLVTKHLIQMPQGSLVHPQNLIITTEMSHTIVIKGDYLQSWEISSKTTFVEFGLAKSDSR